MDLERMKNWFCPPNQTNRLHAPQVSCGDQWQAGQSDWVGGLHGPSAGLSLSVSLSVCLSVRPTMVDPATMFPRRSALSVKIN